MDRIHRAFALAQGAHAAPQAALRGAALVRSPIVLDLSQFESAVADSSAGNASGFGYFEEGRNFSCKFRYPPPAHAGPIMVGVLWPTDESI